ncbi:MAG TPA: cupredoxin domain-containing protein, partial [Thermoanaerobaculia bacterium]|nr:cupredoxin domain-containing protein [Thermoanaerobaculia bacterium]
TTGRPRAPRLAALLPLAMLFPLVLAGLGLAACEVGDDTEPDEVGVEQGTAPGTGATAADGDYFEGEAEPAMPAAGTAAVEVRLHGRTIEMPASLPPGETTFTVTNTGEHEHNFEIEGNGIERELETNLQPGETGELTVTLEPGTYTVYCPVADHREEGMVTTLRVVG